MNGKEKWRFKTFLAVNLVPIEMLYYPIFGILFLGILYEGWKAAKLKK